MEVVPAEVDMIKVCLTIQGRWHRQRSHSLVLPTARRTAPETALVVLTTACIAWSKLSDSFLCRFQTALEFMTVWKKKCLEHKIFFCVKKNLLRLFSGFKKKKLMAFEDGLKMNYSVFAKHHLLWHVKVPFDIQCSQTTRKSALSTARLLFCNAKEHLNATTLNDFDTSRLLRKTFVPWRPSYFGLQSETLPQTSLNSSIRSLSSWLSLNNVAIQV